MNDTESTIIGEAKTGTDDATTENAAETTGKATGTAAETAPETQETDTSLTAEKVGEMIQAALSDYVKQQEQARTEAEKLAGMNAGEKLEYERNQYKAELDSLKSQIAFSQLQGTARAMLAERNIHVPDGIIAAIVTGDAETTKENVTAFAEMYAQAVEDGIKERMKSETPKTGKTSGMTKKQILAVKDAKTRIKLINENMSLFT